MAWMLTWGDRSWSEDDLSVAHAMVITELLERDDWQALSPTSSPRACVAVLATFLAASSGVSIEEAQAAVLAQPFRALVDALTIE